METAAIAVKARVHLRGNVKRNSRPTGGLESRIQNSESRIVTAALEATLKRQKPYHHKDSQAWNPGLTFYAVLVPPGNPG